MNESVDRQQLSGKALLAQPPAGTTTTRSAGMVLCLLLAFLVGGAGLLFASQATLGVALIGCALLLAIAARIAQAGQQHKEVLRALDRTPR